MRIRTVSQMSDFLPVEFGDVGFEPNSNLKNNHFTNRYRHLHQLSLPLTKERFEWESIVIPGDYHGFGVEPPRIVEIPADVLLFRYNNGELWVYKTTVETPAEYGLCAPLLKPPRSDPNSGEGGAFQWYIDIKYTSTLKRRRARDEEHHGVYDAR
jgi:hypothetical protein